MTRQLVVVDTECTGLRRWHVPVEVAAVNVDTGEELCFVPSLPASAMREAEQDALKINRYFERGVYKRTLSVRDTQDAYHQLISWLDGNTFGGSNPTFDAMQLTKHCPCGLAVWHHRLADLAAYAAGVLRLPPTELPGLARVCELLDVTNEDEHSALADARATAECFRKLMKEGHAA